MGLINFTYDFNAGSKTCSWCVKKLPKNKKFWCSVKCCNAEMDYGLAKFEELKAQLEHAALKKHNQTDMERKNS